MRRTCWTSIIAAVGAALLCGAASAAEPASSVTLSAHPDGSQFPACCRSCINNDCGGCTESKTKTCSKGIAANCTLTNGQVSCIGKDSAPAPTSPGPGSLSAAPHHSDFKACCKWCGASGEGCNPNGCSSNDGGAKCPAGQIAAKCKLVDDKHSCTAN